MARASLMNEAFDHELENFSSMSALERVVASTARMGNALTEIVSDEERVSLMDEPFNHELKNFSSIRALEIVGTSTARMGNALTEIVDEDRASFDEAFDHELKNFSSMSALERVVESTAWMGNASTEIASDEERALLIDEAFDHELENLSSMSALEVVGASTAWMGNVLTEIGDSSEIIEDKITRNAFYDATQTAANAVMEVKFFAVSSITVHKEIQMVIRNCERNTPRSFDVLEGLMKKVDVEKLVMPNSLVTLLQDAKSAFENVIRLCDKAVKGKRRKRVKICICMGVCLLGLAIIAAAPHVGIPMVVLGTTATLVAVKIKALTITVMLSGQAVRLLAPLLKGRFVKLKMLFKKTKNEQLLLQEILTNSESIVINFSRVKNQFQKLQSNLQLIAGEMSLAIKWKDMSDISSARFINLIDMELTELEKLCKSCDNVCEIVEKTYEIFEKQPGFVTQCICRGSL